MVPKLVFMAPRLENLWRYSQVRNSAREVDAESSAFQCGQNTNIEGAERTAGVRRHGTDASFISDDRNAVSKPSAQQEFSSLAGPQKHSFL